MRAWLLLIVCLFISQLFFAQAAVEKDWLVTILEKQISSGLTAPFIDYPQVVVDKFGDCYNTGQVVGSNIFDLVMGEEELAAEGSSRDHYYVSKVDGEGNPKWIKRFSGVNFSFYSYYLVPRILPHPDGGIILITSTRYFVRFGEEMLIEDIPERSLFIASIDENGELRDYQLIPSNFWWIHSAISIEGGDIIIAGQADDFYGRIGNHSFESNVKPSYYIARISLDEGVKWLKNIAPEEDWHFAGHTDLIELSDGSIAASFSMGGYHTDRWGCPPERGKIFIAKLDVISGETLWHKEIATVDFAHITSMIERSNGDLYITGAYGGRLFLPNGEEFYATYSLVDCTNRRNFLIKMTEDGMVYDGLVSLNNFYAHKIVNLANGNYMLGGELMTRQNSQDTLSTLAKGMAIKIFSESDQLIHEENLTQDISEAIMDWTIIDENTFVVTGLFGQNFLGEEFIRENSWDRWVFMAKVKLDVEKNSIEPELGQFIGVNIFPNPTTDLLYLELEEGLFEGLSFRLYDSIGRQVKTLPTLGDRTQFYIDISELPTGIYFLQIGEGNANVHKIYKR